MGGFVKRAVALLLCVVMVLPLVSCGKKEEEICHYQNLTLLVGDTYKLYDCDDLNLSLTSTSTNSDVADLCVNQYICAFSGGETVITVKNGREVDVYNVEVLDDGSKIRETVDITDTSIFLGSSFNAFSSTVVPTSSDLNVINAIIPVSVVDAYFSTSGKKPQASKGLKDVYEDFRSNIMSETGKLYETSIAGALGLELPSLGKINAQGKYTDLSKSTNNTHVAVTTITKYTCKGCYMLIASDEELLGMVKQNTRFWKMLTDSEVDPMVLFETYGTHMIQKVDLGGRVDITCMVSVDESNEEKNHLLNIAGDIAGKVSTVNVSVSGSYLSEETEKMKKANISSSTKIEIYGGTLVNVLSIEDYVKNYSIWHESLLNPSTWAVIGIPNDGYTPVWSFLLLDNDDHKYDARIQQLKDAYDSEIVRRAKMSLEEMGVKVNKKAILKMGIDVKDSILTANGVDLSME